MLRLLKPQKEVSHVQEGKFLPWVMRIRHNLVIDYFRKNNRIPTFDNNEEYDIFQLISDGSPTAERSMIDEQVVEDLR